MAAKFVFLCASALFVQSISAQCIGNALAAEELALANAYGGLAANSLAYGSPYAYGAAPCGVNIAPTSGGSFAVISSSPIAPTGISVISENAMEGALSVAGELPFLSAVMVEGALPTAGAGGINYGCGNGAVGIVSENVAPAYGPAAGMGGRFGLGGFPAPGLAASGFGAAGLAASGFGAAGLAAPGFGFNGLAGGCGCGAVY